MRMKSKITVAQLLQCIPDAEIEKIEEELKVNYQVKKITGKNMFKLLLMWMLEEGNTSLRMLERIYNSPEYMVLTEKWKSKTRHTSLSDRLINLDYRFFKRIYEWLVNQFGGALEEKIGSEKFVLKKFDSTLVGLSEKLLHFGMNAWWPKERHIKFSVCMTGKIPTQVRMYDTQSACSEDIALGQVVLENTIEKGEIVVFDRWISKRETYQKLLDNNVCFVTRLNLNVRYKLVSKNEIKEDKIGDLLVKEDLIVKLYHKQEKCMKDSVRMIVCEKENKEKIIFLTNLWDEYDPATITEIYKKRREIEVFFRFIKQEFGFSHFLSRNKNGILSTLYMTLITSILVIIYKLQNRIKGYKEAKRLFIAELKELLLIEFTKTVWWSVTKLKKRYLRHYT